MQELEAKITSTWGGPVQTSLMNFLLLYCGANSVRACIHGVVTFYSTTVYCIVPFPFCSVLCHCSAHSYVCL